MLNLVFFHLARALTHTRAFTHAQPQKRSFCVSEFAVQHLHNRYMGETPLQKFCAGVCFNNFELLQQLNIHCAMLLFAAEWTSLIQVCI